MGALLIVFALSLAFKGRGSFDGWESSDPATVASGQSPGSYMLRPVRPSELLNSQRLTDQRDLNWLQLSPLNAQMAFSITLTPLTARTAGQAGGAPFDSGPPVFDCVDLRRLPHPSRVHHRLSSRRSFRSYSLVQKQPKPVTRHRSGVGQHSPTCAVQHLPGNRSYSQTFGREEITSNIFFGLDTSTLSQHGWRLVALLHQSSKYQGGSMVLEC